MRTSPDGIECPLCGGNGYIIVEKNGYEEAVECKCMPERRLKSRLRFAGLPEGLKDIRLNTFSIAAYHLPESRQIASAACKMIKYYLDNLDQMLASGMGLYLYSSCKGSGKTRMMASIANELIYTHGISVKFATSISILDEIKSSWDSKEYTERELLDALFIVPVLIIDDFGVERATSFVNDRFYQIINQRYINKRVTLFTSNMSLKNLNYDDRITNRVKEMTYAIDFPEESVREHIAADNHRKMMSGIYEQQVK